MAKTLVTLDGKLINYENIVSVSVELGDFMGDNGEISNDVYGLIAIDVSNAMHVLGVYENRSKAVEAEKGLREWLECEAFGVYSFGKPVGDD